MEFKSYKITSVDKFLSVKQLKAYLEKSEEISQMSYVFNKLETPDLLAVKLEFQKIFTRDAESIFISMNPALKAKLGLTDVDSFLDLVDNPNSTLYDFIEWRIQPRSA